MAIIDATSSRVASRTAGWLEGEPLTPSFDAFDDVDRAVDTAVELVERRLEPREILLYRVRRVLVIFFNRKIQKITGVITARVQCLDGAHNRLQ